MKIGIFGTGMVAQTLAASLSKQGHQVVLGTRDPAASRTRTAPGAFGQPPLSAWIGEHPTVGLATYADAARHGDVLINATSGEGALPALAAAGAEALGSKVMLDIANPLDFSKGMPPSLSVCNTDSLGERIQAAYPQLKVVKTLNTLTAALMVNPAAVGGGETSIFVSGNDADAKSQVTTLLREWFGWKDVIDLGDITTARGTEMLLPVWIRLWGALGTPMFNFRIVR